MEQHINLHPAAEKQRPTAPEALDKQAAIALGSGLQVRLVEQKEQVQACFEAQLTGVFRPGVTSAETPAARDDETQARDRWELPAGHTLTLVQSIAETRYRCELSASISSPTASQALHAAEQYWRSLRLGFGMGHRGGYRIQPAREIQRGNPHKWSARIRRLRVILGGAPRTPGFITPPPASNRILALSVPTAYSPRPLNRLPRLAQLCETPLQVSVAMESMILDEPTRVCLEGTLAALDHARALRIEGYQAFPDAIAEEDLANTLTEELRGWLHWKRGIRTECRVNAPEPLPDALIRWIGLELFGDSLFAFHSGEEAEIPGDIGVDPAIADCVPAGGRLPRLLPSSETLVAAGLDNLPPNSPPAPRQEGIALGRDANGGSRRLVRFALNDRSRHCYIVGATGTGKSTLLCNMIRQDIEAGSGVCLIDPHGDLYREVLESVPEKRIPDLVCIDLTDAERTAGINLLECTGPNLATQRNFVTNEMIRIFDRLYDLHLTGGPMFEHYMRNALLLVGEVLGNQATLVDIPPVFEDKRFRKRLVNACQNPFVASFWHRQAERAGGEASLENIAPYITSKLNQFTHNALLRPIIGQARSTVDFRSCMDDGRIVLVNLAKGLLGGLDTQLIGMLIIGKIFGTAMQRTDLPERERRPYHLYIDEAHNFVTDTVTQLLAEARKFGLTLTLASQNLMQLAGNAGQNTPLEAVLGNVGTLILFRVGPFDADRLVAHVRPHLDMTDLMYMPDHTAAVKLLSAGRPSRPFLLSTLPPMGSRQLSNAQRLQRQRALAAQKQIHTRPISEVEGELRQRYHSSERELGT